MRAAASDGQIDFGENKVQEALGKIEATADLKLRWHLVGHLQSNKARKARRAFDAVHSVDDAALVRRIDEAALADRPHNRSARAGGSGGRSHQTRRAEPERLTAIFEQARACRAARVVGLMLLPPAVDDAEAARPYFKALGRLRDRLTGQGVDPSMLRELSMGMSHDFEVAVEEGATMVRVGTAIFGTR